MCAQSSINFAVESVAPALGGKRAVLLAQIEACRAGLRGFGQTSDLEFGPLAQGLSRLNVRLAELRTQTASLDSVLRECDEGGAIASAYSLYKESSDLIYANADIEDSVQKELCRIEAELSDSYRRREVFERERFSLRLAPINNLIEVGFLSAEEQSIFFQLASAIVETGSQIECCTGRAFRRIEEIVLESQATRVELKETEHTLFDLARKSIETIQQQLPALQAALAPCSAQNRTGGELLAKAQPQTLAVIGALQYQDIVRQRLEHVSEGFQDLHDHFQTADAPDNGTRPISDVEWAYVHQVVLLQAAQLKASRTEIKQASTAVIGGLRQLLEISATMGERFSTMEGSAATTLDSRQITPLFSQGLQKLTCSIDYSRRANKRMSSLVDRIVEIVRLSSEEIRGYQLDVKILALEEKIAARRLSSAEALNKLMEEARQVSADTHVLRQLSTDFHTHLGNLDQMKCQNADFLAIITAEKEQLEGDLNIVGEKLARLMGQVRAGSIQTHREFDLVHADCLAVLDKFAFPSLIESTFAPAAQLCDDLVALIPPSMINATPSVAALIKIEHHRRRYTMQAELDTHAAADRRMAALVPPAAPEATVKDTLPHPSAPPCKSNANDGIELF